MGCKFCKWLPRPKGRGRKDTGLRGMGPMTAGLPELNIPGKEADRATAQFRPRGCRLPNPASRPSVSSPTCSGILGRPR